MLSLKGRPFRCDDGVTRRSFLHAGALGLAGLGLGDLLRLRAQAGPVAARAMGDDLSVILVWLDGGPPQHETYDPKPDAPAEFRGPFKAIDTAVPGVQVSELLPEHARLMRQDVDHPLDASQQRRSLRRRPLDADRLPRRRTR